ncbi:MAG: glycosyltransferase family 4 protein [Actinomycetota bacterium]|nr:glycosyltransferase family 4 protein [Actinomycetota bacterium]
MRVIHISPTAFGAAGLFGGGERYPVELARALASKVECELVTFGPTATTYRNGDLRVTVLKRSMLLHAHPAHPVARGIVGAVSRGDVVHAHHLRALPTRAAAIAAAVTRRPRVVTDHGLGPGRWPQVDARLFDRFLTVSSYSARTLAAPPSKTDVIYGGADLTRFHPVAGRRRAGVVFVGRLTPHKGVDHVIAALPQAATLTVAGTAGHDPDLPERDYPSLLQRLAEGRDVRFVGPVPEDRLPDLYRSARVLVLPSVHRTHYGKHVAIPELLGLTLIEAMASGTPVIASNLGGLPEVVVDGVTGFLVQPGDRTALTQRMEQLLHDDRLAAEMGQNARDHVVSRFTWDRCAQRCVKVYEALTGAA